MASWLIAGDRVALTISSSEASKSRFSDFAFAVMGIFQSSCFVMRFDLANYARIFVSRKTAALSDLRTMSTSPQAEQIEQEPSCPDFPPIAYAKFSVAICKKTKSPRLHSKPRPTQIRVVAGKER